MSDWSPLAFCSSNVTSIGPTPSTTAASNSAMMSSNRATCRSGARLDQASRWLAPSAQPSLIRTDESLRTGDVHTESSDGGSMHTQRTMFSRTVTDYWLTGDAAADDLLVGEFRVVVDDSLPANRSLMTLDHADGGVLTLTSARAASLDLAAGSLVSRAALRSALEAAEVSLNGADHLFYLPNAEHAVVRAEAVPEGTRQLTDADADSFAQFADAAPAAEFDEAFVELDHWLVFGTFAEGRLVAAASMYPWSGTQLADLGVITLPGCRGRGFAKRTVRAISARALAEGLEPQYRCQLDNEPSVALARAAGFARFGTWDVIAPDA